MTYLKFIFRTLSLALLLAVAGNDTIYGQVTTGGNSIPTVNTPNDDIYTQRDKVERRSGSFSPSYFTNPDNRHYQIRLEVTGQGLRAAEVQRAAGKIPHLEKENGEVQVTVRDASGRSLLDYYVDNPLVVRSCEEDWQGGALPVGTSFYLPLPNNSNAATLEFSNLNNGEPLQLDISALVRRAGQ